MRGRIAGAGMSALALAAMLAALGSPVASAACPNEAFRTGPSALLPECRAYEQVTPVDKESGEGVIENGPAIVSPSGNSIFYTAPSAYAGAQQGVLKSPYVALRTGETWEVDPVGASLTAPGTAVFGIVAAVSPDLRFTLLVSNEALAPGGIAKGSNVYLRENLTGTYTLVEAFPGESNFANWAQSDARGILYGAARDWSDLLIGTADGLAEFREGQLRLAVPGAAAAGSTPATPNVMSADGSRFFYVENEHLYLYRLGQEPLLVSENEEGNPISVGYPGGFVGATPDGNISFFQGADEVLYRFDASAPPGKRISVLTPSGPGGESPSVLRAVVGEDGDHAYFAARGLLTPDAEPRQNFFEGFDLYAWRGETGGQGQLRYLGKSEAAGNELVNDALAVSRDGLFFGFESYGQVTPDAVDGSVESCPVNSLSGNPAGRCANVFTYSTESDRVTCVSCTGSAPAGSSRLGGSIRLASANVARPVLDDGMVLFDTPNALVGRDVNGVRDVYSWQDGRTQLISPGTEGVPASFIAASDDGSNLFFQTEQPLVGQDSDPILDLYDARVEGGLPEGAPATEPSCVLGGGCRGTAESASSPGVPGTVGLLGAGNVADTCVGLRKKAASARKRSRALARRARRAEGRRAKGLRRGAKRETNAARRLDRRAGDCTGGGR